MEKSSLKHSYYEKPENKEEGEEEDTIIGPVLLLGVSVQDFRPSEHCTSTQKMAAIGKRGK